MFVIPFTTGSTFLLKLLRCSILPWHVPISTSHPGLKKSAQGRMMSAWCRTNTEVRRINPNRALRTNGGNLQRAEDKQMLVSRQLIAWSQICRVHFLLILQTTPYDALTLWCEA